MTPDPTIAVSDITGRALGDVPDSPLARAEPFHLERLGVVLEKTELSFEDRAVLNPGCLQEGSTIHMFYRAVATNQVSSVGYARYEKGTELTYRSVEPILRPEFDYESHGIEDPRITKIDDTYYLIYVAYDGLNARIAYATSPDLVTFTKQGVISANLTYVDAIRHIQDSGVKTSYTAHELYIEDNKPGGVVFDKDGFLFPEKIHGQFALVHRILPEIQVILFDSFEQLKDESFWTQHFRNLKNSVLIENTEWFEARYIGGGCPPIRTERGWLMIYHGVHETNRQKTYSIGAALLDLDNPTVMIKKLREPLLVPQETYEVQGDVHNVVFPTGTAQFEDCLFIYYGAADERIAVTQVSLTALLDEIEQYGINRP